LERLDALEIRTHWWRAPVAQNALDAWREKMEFETKKDAENKE
jgi:hypothetical protein